MTRSIRRIATNKARRRNRNPEPGTKRNHGEAVVPDIRRASRTPYTAEETVRIPRVGRRDQVDAAPYGAGLHGG